MFRPSGDGSDDPADLVRQRHQDPQLEKPRNRVRLGDLLEVNPENYQWHQSAKGISNTKIHVPIIIQTAWKERDAELKRKRRDADCSGEREKQAVAREKTRHQQGTRSRI
ncbi:hypothetical protein Tco_0941269 [Tanacetum coccineum]|uniref:Uncharacterized protein n=1 Tax=Tanacetum coccineum TaxID=301880 RepID=A0ABQ5DRC3_9ASTR